MNPNGMPSFEAGFGNKPLDIGKNTLSPEEFKKKLNEITQTKTEFKQSISGLKNTITFSSGQKNETAPLFPQKKFEKSFPSAKKINFNTSVSENISKINKINAQNLDPIPTFDEYKETVKGSTEKRYNKTAEGIAARFTALDILNKKTDIPGYTTLKTTLEGPKKETVQTMQAFLYKNLSQSNPTLADVFKKSSFDGNSWDGGFGPGTQKAFNEYIASYDTYLVAQKEAEKHNRIKQTMADYYANLKKPSVAPVVKIEVPKLAEILPEELVPGEERVTEKYQNAEIITSKINGKTKEIIRKMKDGNIMKQIFSEVPTGELDGKGDDIKENRITEVQIISKGGETKKFTKELSIAEEKANNVRIERGLFGGIKEDLLATTKQSIDKKNIKIEKTKENNITTKITTYPNGIKKIETRGGNTITEKIINLDGTTKENKNTLYADGVISRRLIETKGDAQGKIISQKTREYDSKQNRTLVGKIENDVQITYEDGKEKSRMNIQQKDLVPELLATTH